MGLEDTFKEAAERVKQLPEASNDDQLELYSLFKQSNIGDCDTGKWTSCCSERGLGDMSGNLTLPERRVCTCVCDC